ncbi:triokinase/FMN cyclase-like [Ochlerotatus camptorhynchus]|uniref:triokinase/FMN cyclase-like n=1 Tax=Ochlerotatus camptorhynchus TaxID=644619 RepID=UPI0031DCB15C
MSLSDVGSALQGLILSQGGLKLLKDRNCIVRLDNDPKDETVKLISGGGSGHEPAHAGYVGQGMLSGAVCGNVFSSPSVTAILDCLRTVTDRDGGVIFIVKNYTGDRLNFGIAVELARTTYGFRDVRMLLVGEDCSIENEKVRKSVGKRGLAGVVLVHKILGAMAESGMTIEDVYSFGEGLVESGNLATIGFTFELNDGTLENIEIGKGIHGEPGVYTMQACKDFEEIIDFIIGKLVTSVPKSAEVVLLVNNLGGTSEFLMSVFLEAFLNKIEHVYGVKRIYSGAYLTSLDQAGISVTVLNNGYSQNLLEYLDCKVNVASALFGSTSRFALPPSKVVTVEASKPLKIAESSNACSISSEFGAKLALNIVHFVCEALVSCTGMLNTIDKETGDGDTGSTVGKGAESVLQHLIAKKLDLMHPGILLQQISIILQQDMGGSSGALYSLFFQGAASTFMNTMEAHQSIGIEHWSQALSNGNDKIVKYAFTQLGDRTMLDPLREGEKRLKQSIVQGLPLLDCVESFTKGCEEAARATQHMVPKSGRASYAASSETPKSYQFADPGALGVSIWARALLEACRQVIVE